jgi:hypothetical protein
VFKAASSVDLAIPVFTIVFACTFPTKMAVLRSTSAQVEPAEELAPLPDRTGTRRIAAVPHAVHPTRHQGQHTHVLVLDAQLEGLHSLHGKPFRLDRSTPGGTPGLVAAYWSVLYNDPVQFNCTAQALR